MIDPKYSDMNVCKRTGEKRTEDNQAEFVQCPNCTGVTKLSVLFSEQNYYPMVKRTVDGKVEVAIEDGIQKPQYVSAESEVINLRSKHAHRCSHCGYEYTDAESLTLAVPQTAVTVNSVIKNPELDFLRSFEIEFTATNQLDTIAYIVVLTVAGSIVSEIFSEIKKVSAQARYKATREFSYFIPIPTGAKLSVVPVNYNGYGTVATLI